MGTGKKKIVIKRMEKEEQRMVTFSKRRQGLFKKAAQLHSLTGAHIAVLVFSPAGRLYTHGDPSFDQVVDRYVKHAAVGVNGEGGSDAEDRRLKSWLDALHFEACDSVKELQFLKKELESIAAKVAEEIGDRFADSLLI